MTLAPVRRNLGKRYTPFGVLLEKGLFLTSDHSKEMERLRADADYMHFLVEAGELLSSSLDYRSTLRNVCAAAVKTIADICILDIGGSARDVEAVAMAHRQKELAKDLSCLERQLESHRGRPAHPVCRVLDSGQTFFAPHINEQWIEEHAANPLHAQFMERMRYRSMIVVPVRSQIWGVTGALTLIRTDASHRAYDTEAVTFAEDLGRRCGIAIGKARLYSQTADVAERLQKAALPQSLPSVPGFSFDVLYEPADAALLVGGDWYDVFHLPDGKIGISIGDVSGHGIESAAQMSSIRNALRMALVMEDDLRKVLKQADFLFRNEVAEGTFCTAIVGILDPLKRTLRCASAGHPSPLFCTMRGVEAPLDERVGAPLAVGDIAKKLPEEAALWLEPDSMIVLYTDGLLESDRSPLAGERRLRDVVRNPAIRRSATPARDIRDACVAGWHGDDIAVLVIRSG